LRRCADKALTYLRQAPRDACCCIRTQPLTLRPTGFSPIDSLRRPPRKVISRAGASPRLASGTLLQFSTLSTSLPQTFIQWADGTDSASRNMHQSESGHPSSEERTTTRGGLHLLMLPNPKAFLPTQFRVGDTIGTSREKFRGIRLVRKSFDLVLVLSLTLEDGVAPEFAADPQGYQVRDCTPAADTCHFESPPSSSSREAPSRRPSQTFLPTAHLRFSTS